jgi:methionyl aminopeptidase
MSDVSFSVPAKLPGPNEPCYCGSGVKFKKCHRGAPASVTGPPRVQRGKVSPRRLVPPEIIQPDYVSNRGRPGPGRPGDPSTRLERMRRACRAAVEVMEETARALRPGITTDELDGIAHAGYIARGGYPSTLGYRGFQKSLCTSVNDVVLHGIPDSRPLEKGDIINLDVTIYLDGMHGDCSATYGVEEIDETSQKLIRVTREAMMLGIEAVKPGLPINVIGKAIETYANAQGYGVVRHYGGHGIGEVFHTPLHISHFYDPQATTVIEEGMFFTIEPMLTIGDPLQLRDWSDGWTVVTDDGQRSAQFEHTIHVTRDGAEILTQLD